MKKRLVGILSVLLSLTQLFMGNASAQNDESQNFAITPDLLDYWEFNNTNWLSDWGYSPRSFTNIDNVAGWDGNALQVDNSDAAWLQYNAENDGWPALTCDQGALRFWFQPNWDSGSLGGSGPGDWGRFIDAGAWTSNASSGWWSLYLDPDGANVYFSAQANGASTNYLSAPIAWASGAWHQIALVYSATNTALYLDGQCVTNGPGVTCFPGADALTNGFFVGSAATGQAQMHGVLDDLETYDCPLDADTITNDYAMVLPLRARAARDGPGRSAWRRGIRHG